MKIHGQPIIISGVIALVVALEFPKSESARGEMTMLYDLTKAPWTNLLFIFYFSGFLVLFYLLKKPPFLYNLHLKAISSFQIFIGLLANFALISLLVDTFFNDIVNGTPPLGIDHKIIIAISIFWWPLAYFYFKGYIKKREEKLQFIRSIWTTGGVFLLLEIFRGTFARISHFYYWLENSTYSVLSVTGFFLILFGGIITECFLSAQIANKK